MSDKTKLGANRMHELPFAWPNMSEALSLQAKAWMEEQAELLSATQEMIGAWTRRRQEAMEAAIRAAQTISTSKDFGAVAQAYSEWFTGSMQRVQADLADARDEALRFAEMERSPWRRSPEGSARFRQARKRFRRALPLPGLRTQIEQQMARSYKAQPSVRPQNRNRS